AAADHAAPAPAPREDILHRFATTRGREHYVAVTFVKLFASLHRNAPSPLPARQCARFRGVSGPCRTCFQYTWEDQGKGLFFANQLLNDCVDSIGVAI